MAVLRDILRRIRSVRSTHQITSAMKMVAAAKLRKAQAQAEQQRPYAEKMTEILSSLAAVTAGPLVHPYFERREARRKTLVLITSDRGLCGAFNSNLIRQAETWLLGHEQDKVELVCVGRRAHWYFRRRAWEIVKAYTTFNGQLDPVMIRDLVTNLTNRFISHQTDEIYLLYTKFHSVSRVTVTFEKYLNIEPPTAESNSFGAGYIFEPNPQEIFAELLPRYALVRLRAALADSFASEFAARMMAMTMATANAEEVIDRLTLQFNKARQAAITKEILEVVSGADALKT